MNEFEIISPEKMKGLRVFFGTSEYRTSHLHPEWELIWVLEEALSVGWRRQHLSLKSGDIFLFQPNEIHEFQKIEKPGVFFCVQISPDFSQNIPSVSLDTGLVSRSVSEGQLCRIRELLAGLADAYLHGGPYWELLCQGQGALLLHALLTHLPCRPLTALDTSNLTIRNARLSRLFKFVEENHTQKIKLSDFAAAEGCSLSYMSHFVKEALNQSFQDYVRSVRFRHACRLIDAGATSMLEVCMESGFSDYRYFSKTFQAFCGMTPAARCRKAKAVRQQPATPRSIRSVEHFCSEEEAEILFEKYLAPFLPSSEL